MIHYTLLPEKEIKELKREYRIRLFISILFFISIAIVIGIFSLMPAFIMSYSQEKSALNQIELVRKNRNSKEIENIIKELKQDSDDLKKININNKVSYSEIISDIISEKGSGISLNSFQFIIPVNTASSTISFVIQGKSLTRDALIKFKNKLESNPSISSVELPVSDLAKSKDIDFSIKISLILPR